MIGYSTEQQLNDYADARDILILGDPAVLLTKALDWLELQPFKGSKTDPDQANEWPRDGYTTVPERIKTAQLVAALIYESGGNPLQAIGPRVTSETVVGAVSVTYSDTGPLVQLYPQLNMLLRGYVSGGANQMRVIRA